MGTLWIGWLDNFDPRPQSTTTVTNSRPKHAPHWISTKTLTTSRPPQSTTEITTSNTTQSQDWSQTRTWIIDWQPKFTATITTSRSTQSHQLGLTKTRATARPPPSTATITTSRPTQSNQWSPTKALTSGRQVGSSCLRKAILNCLRLMLIAFETILIVFGRSRLWWEDFDCCGMILIVLVRF